MDNTDLRYERTHTAIGQAVTEKLYPDGFRLSFAWGLARRTYANSLDEAKQEAIDSAANSQCAVSLLDGRTYSVIGTAEWTSGGYVFQEAA